MKTANERCKFSATDDTLQLQLTYERYTISHHITAQKMGNNEWRTALISGHVCKNGKQMDNERTKNANIYRKTPNQCLLEKFIIN